MTSQVFYRKWRPQTLSGVMGQEHVTQTLLHAVEGGRVAHAYLFCGPRGTGKTSTGRILAKAVNCLSPVGGEPCNTCDMCEAVNEGSALDIIEIDAASNRGIDEIRDLKEKVSYAPNIAHYKVYIIDEVHMITKEAANAFLKTLEEPPAHAIFILATTEPHKVLATILSRCQRFDFHRLLQSAVISKLELVCANEAIEITPEAMRLVAKVTTGSLRDAENLLEQLVAYYGHHIELDQVQTMLGITGDQRVRELARYVITRDISAGLKTINSVSADGLDLRQFNREFVNYLRDLLLVKSGSEDVVDVTDDVMAEMKQLTETIGLDSLLVAVKLFGGADIRLDNYSPLPLELALAECVLSGNTIETPTAKPAPTAPVAVSSAKTPNARTHQPKTEKPVEEKQPVSERQVVEEPAGKVDESPVASVEQAEESPPIPTEQADEIPPPTPIEQITDTPTPAPVAATAQSADIEAIRGQWNAFIQAMRGEGSRGNLDAVLRSACEPVAIEDNVLVLGFYHPFHKDYIEDPKYRHLVEKKLRQVFGRTYQVRCVLTERTRKPQPQSENGNRLVQAALEMGAKMIDDKPITEEK